MDDEESLRVVLARMEGKQDVANERLNNLQVDVAGLRTRVHDHGNELTRIVAERAIMVKDYDVFKQDTGKRLTAVEQSQTDTTGQRKGIFLSGRAMAWIASAIVGAGAVAAEFLK